MQYSKWIVLGVLSVFVLSCGGGGVSTDNPDSSGGVGTVNETPSTPSQGGVPTFVTGESFPLIRLPLYIWPVVSPEVPAVSSRLTDQDITEYVRRANIVWEPANITFFVQEINPITLNEENAQSFADFLRTTPPGERGFDRGVEVLFNTGQYTGGVGRLNVVLMPDFGDAPGVAIFRHSLIMVSEFGLQNGIPNHNILAHELAHALRLAHVNLPQEVCNIMVAGSCLSSTLQNTEDSLLIKKFNQCQIDIARNVFGEGFAPSLDISSEQCLSSENIL